MRLHFAAWKDLIKRYGTVWQAVWKQRRLLASPSRTPTEREFLPAALELEETPVSPLPRVAMGLIVSFVLIALAWAILGKLDVVVTAGGKIVPNDRTKIIQPMETAVVRAIYVEDGQQVKAGDVLLELDATAADADEKRTEAEIAANRAVLAKLKETLPIVQERAREYKKLYEQDFVSKHEFLDKEKERIDLEHEMVVQTSKLAEADQERIKATQRARLMKLTAPVSGKVQQLAIHTIGGVVTPAQPILAIVPTEDSVEIEASILNKDIGFVREGQEAVIKVEAFPYTKYGTIPGQVKTVSLDSATDEKKGLIFFSRVEMLKNSVQVEDKAIPLTPGMAVSVEIKTGKRRVIEYFLSPLLEHADESLRER